MSAPRRPPALLALSPGDLAPAHLEGFLADLRRAVEAGLRGLLLREPQLGERAYLELARASRRVLARELGGWLGVHDRAHLARAADADGVHLGGRSLAPEEVRPWLDGALCVGLSTHAGDDPARWQGADYLLHAPVFEVPGKSAPLGPGGLERCVRASAVAVWALGGLRPENVALAMQAGACGVAVLRGILSGPDPAAATEAYLQALERHASAG